jgi:hypothetical protein
MVVDRPQLARHIRLANGTRDVIYVGHNLYLTYAKDSEGLHMH